MVPEIRRNHVERCLLNTSSMLSLRTSTSLLCLSLSLLAPACGNGGNDGDGGDGANTTSDATTATTGTSLTEGVDSTDSLDPTDSPDPTEAGSSGTDGSSTLEPTGIDGSSSTGDTTTGSATEADTEADTTGEPVAGPCDDLIAPDPANAFIDFAEVVHSVKNNNHYFNLGAFDGDNSWDVIFFDLGNAEPVPGTFVKHEIVGDELLGEAGGGVNGTATLELLTVTPECVTGRVSELALDGEVYFVDEELEGGFVATRRSVG